MSSIAKPRTVIQGNVPNEVALEIRRELKRGKGKIGGFAWTHDN
jgi:hypothetical protein